MKIIVEETESFKSQTLKHFLVLRHRSTLNQGKYCFKIILLREKCIVLFISILTMNLARDEAHELQKIKL